MRIVIEGQVVKVDKRMTDKGAYEIVKILTEEPEPQIFSIFTTDNGVDKGEKIKWIVEVRPSLYKGYPVLNLRKVE